MATVTEYQATREQVVEFRADVERVMRSFDQSRREAVPGSDTKELIRELRAKWDEQRQARGRRMAGGGVYGHLYEAIIRLPRLTEPKKWHSSLYDALASAPFIEGGE